MSETNTDIQKYESLESQDDSYAREMGFRKLNFFSLLLKTFLGFAGGVIGSLVLLLIFLGATSVLQPVLFPNETSFEKVNAVFIMVIMGMILVTTLISGTITPFLLSLTERERYTRIPSAIYQIFIFNFVILLFVSPIYLTTSVSNMSFYAYAAGLQIILATTASALIMEILHDQKYSLMSVYSSLLGILTATASALMIYQLLQSGTVLLFIALPLAWGFIGFFQAFVPIVYFWYYMNYGIDFMSSGTDFGTDKEVQEENEQEIQEVIKDEDGEDFFKS